MFSGSSSSRRWAGRVCAAAVLIAVAIANDARANAGTPLMWAGALHLFFGNALIGVLEGLLIARFFRVPRFKAIGRMILANYVSACFGIFLIDTLLVNRIEMNLTNAWRWFWIMVGIAYLLTLVIEWPAIALLFRGSASWFKRSVKASLLVQTVSYGLLFGWYGMAGRVSLYTGNEIVEASQIELPDQVVVYYIDQTDGCVYRRALGKGQAQKIHELNSHDSNDRLSLRANKDEPGTWDLVARLDVGTRKHAEPVEVLTRMKIQAAPVQPEGRDDRDNTWFTFGEVPRLGSAVDSPWRFRVDFWASAGLSWMDRGTGEISSVAYETPFGTWYIRNAVHLPRDKVLFQLGADEICVYDPVAKQVASLWRGRGPVAVIEGTE